MLERYQQVIVLVRHAEAKSTEEDPTRPLSVVGLQQAEDSEEDAKDGLEASDAPLELGDPHLKLGLRGVQAGH